MFVRPVMTYPPNLQHRAMGDLTVYPLHGWQHAQDADRIGVFPGTLRVGVMPFRGMDEHAFHHRQGCEVAADLVPARFVGKAQPLAPALRLIETPAPVSEIEHRVPGDALLAGWHDGLEMVSSLRAASSDHLPKTPPSPQPTLT